MLLNNQWNPSGQPAGACESVKPHRHFWASSGCWCSGGLKSQGRAQPHSHYSSWLFPATRVKWNKANQCLSKAPGEPVFPWFGMALTLSLCRMLIPTALCFSFTTSQQVNTTRTQFLRTPASGIRDLLKVQRDLVPRAEKAARRAAALYHRLVHEWRKRWFSTVQASL